jgi:hypothetical protein
MDAEEGQSVNVLASTVIFLKQLEGSLNVNLFGTTQE